MFLFKHTLNIYFTCDLLGLWGDDLCAVPMDGGLEGDGITAVPVRRPKESPSTRYRGSRKEENHKMILQIEKFMGHLRFRGVLMEWKRELWKENHVYFVIWVLDLLLCIIQYISKQINKQVQGYMFPKAKFALPVDMCRQLYSCWSPSCCHCLQQRWHKANSCGYRVPRWEGWEPFSCQLQPDLWTGVISFFSQVDGIYCNSKSCTSSGKQNPEVQLTNCYSKHFFSSIK